MNDSELVTCRRGKGLHVANLRKFLIQNQQTKESQKEHTLFTTVLKNPPPEGNQRIIVPKENPPPKGNQRISTEFYNSLVQPRT
jgi:hypothetical protein